MKHHQRILKQVLIKKENTGNKNKQKNKNA